MGLVTSSPDSAVIRVLVVDDSAVIRGLETRWLNEDDDIDVVASAVNGAVAVDAYRKHRPDVVVLDIEMPVMDGITALQKIIEVDNKAKVIMSSSLTQRNAEISIRALSLGASDYVTKPTSSGERHDKDGFRRELVEKIKAIAKPQRAATARTAAAKPLVSKPEPSAPRPAPERRPISLRKPAIGIPSIVAVGSSTGGPQALYRIFGDIAKPLRQPVVITQHMPATFTAIFATHLTKATGLDCREAADGETLVGGQVYVAPGDYHLLIESKDGRFVARLDQGPKENFCRPAVDPMLRSLSQCVRARVFAAVLTGMGQDGLEGGKLLIEAGGTMIAQDEASSVVWGMPGAVANGGLCSAVLPLDKIGATIERFAGGGGL